MFFLFLRAKTVFHNLVPKYIYFFLNTKPILKNYSQKLFSFNNFQKHQSIIPTRS